MKDNLTFLSTFLRHPLATGAIAPSSRLLGRVMIEGMQIEGANTVVELGPGTGAFTGIIEKAVRPDALYFAIELNKGFARDLQRKFPRVKVVNDSASNICAHLRSFGREHADAIVCSLPWASFPPALQEEIMGAVVRSLRPGGSFATFAYVHASWFPTARNFQRWLELHFSRVSRTKVIWKNFPPAFIYRCEKSG